MPDPNKFNNRDDFISACMKETKGEKLKGGRKKTMSDRLGKCFGMWRNKKGSKSK